MDPKVAGLIPGQCFALSLSLPLFLKSNEKQMFLGEDKKIKQKLKDT